MGRGQIKVFAQKDEWMEYRAKMIAVLLLSAAVANGTESTTQPAGVGAISPSAAVQDEKTGMLWYDAKLLTIEGKGWAETEEFYDRLPPHAQGKVPEHVWNLSKRSAGLAVRFITNSPRIRARWKVGSNLAMPHMPATGVSGLDLYVRWRGKWRWAGMGKPTSENNEAMLVDSAADGRHEYLLYLPLYNKTLSLQIGIPSGYVLTNPGPRAAKPICVYGTSIVQGGCASRPGLAHVAILGRKLDMPTINLGFSGSGKMEPEMAKLLAELDVSAYVLDCLPNMTVEMVRERFEPFVQTLRQARPETPIVLVEHVPHGGEAFLPGRRTNVERMNRTLRLIHRDLQAKGVTGLSYVPYDQLLGTDGEGTVDGVHPNDIGFLRFADAMEPTLRQVVGAGG
jgi:lysophospholipase L1-like esterase